MYEDQEVAKWRKKKGRQSKVERRADHKHNYAPAYKILGDKENAVRGFYCTVCKKWKPGPWFWKAEDRAAWDAAHSNAVYVVMKEDKCCVVDFYKKI